MFINLIHQGTWVPTSKGFSRVLNKKLHIQSPGLIAQSVASLTVVPGVTSSIPAQSHTLMEIDHEIISMVIILPQLIQEGLFVVS